MNIGYVLFLLAALFLCAMILINYIQSQAELTAKISKISRLEKELITIKRSNDEEIKRLESSTDLEEIKRRAITELGMVYANENQVIIYHSPDQDYMRKMD